MTSEPIQGNKLKPVEPDQRTLESQQLRIIQILTLFPRFTKKLVDGESCSQRRRNVSYSKCMKQ